MTLLLNFEMILASNKATLVHKDYLFLEMAPILDGILTY